jgi:hypothetical protein
MDRKGQSAMEYVTTYGWAILVVIIIGVVLWQMGVFDVGSRVTPGFVGFSVLVPRDWALTKAGGSCSLDVEFSNAAGEELNSVTVLGGGTCTPDEVLPGKTTTCSKIIVGCGEAGRSFEEQIVVTYQRSSDNQSFQTAGNIWGNVGGS